MHDNFKPFRIECAFRIFLQSNDFQRSHCNASQRKKASLHSTILYNLFSMETKNILRKACPRHNLDCVAADGAAVCFPSLLLLAALALVPEQCSLGGEGSRGGTSMAGEQLKKP